MQKKCSRAQSSIEFIILVGFVMMILIPLIAIFFTQTRDANHQIILRQADMVAKQIADNAESMYYLGAPSKTTLRVYIPENVVNITIANNEVVFYISVGNATTEIVEHADVNITGAVSSSTGLHHIVVEAHPGYVLISE